ncbi:MAG: YbhN family protein [Actinomycetota bacterium]|nr:YbhN family protein [Actinomycetota bacterium]
MEPPRQPSDAPTADEPPGAGVHATPGGSPAGRDEGPAAGGNAGTPSLDEGPAAGGNRRTPSLDEGPAAGGNRRTPDRDASAARRDRLLRWWHSPPLRVVVALLLLFFVLEYVLLPDAANARRSLYLLGRVNIVGLLIGVALEAAALFSYAELTHTVLSPGAPHRFLLFRVNMSSLAVSHVVPGGTAPGTAVAYRLLTDLDVPSSTAAFGLATQGVGSAVMLNAIFFLALFISIPLTGYNPLYGFAALVGLILFALFAGTVLLLTRGQRRALEHLHDWAGKIPLVNADKVTSLVQTIADRLQVLLRDRSLLLHATMWAAANWLFDAASLWVFVLSFGHLVSPVDLLVAYGLANILAFIPITPSGLGVVEGVLISTLRGFHVPLTVATLGVLSYRLVNFWLPIPAGGAAYLSLRRRSDVSAKRKLRIRLHRGRAHQADSGGEQTGEPSEQEHASNASGRPRR